MRNVQEILEWYVEAGVDVLLDDEPIDRFRETPPPPRHKPAKIVNASPEQFLAKKKENNSQQSRKATSSVVTATIPDDQVKESARNLARSANTIEELKTALESFEGCNLKRTAKSLVFADGEPNTRLMIIGDSPDREEDTLGSPFAGKSGQLLTRMLAAIGLDRSDVYLTNIIPWRPPGSRPPTPQETEICRPFIERHIELARPEVVLLLGGLPAKTLLNSPDGIMRLRGKWNDLNTQDITVPALTSLHPTYLLSQPAHKALAWQDLLQLKIKLFGA